MVELHRFLTETYSLGHECFEIVRNGWSIFPLYGNSKSMRFTEEATFAHYSFGLIFLNVVSFLFLDGCKP